MRQHLDGRRPAPLTLIFEDDGGSCQLGRRLLTILYIFSTATSTCIHCPVDAIDLSARIIRSTMVGLNA